MKRTFTIVVLTLFSFLTLHAQNSGIVRFQVDLNCSEPYVDPNLISSINLRAWSEIDGDNGIPGNDRTGYTTYAMTETAPGSGIYTYDYSNNGGAGSSDIRWYYQAEMETTPATTITEALGNNWGENFYGCKVAFSNGDIRKENFSGLPDRIVRNAFGHCTLCNGKDVTFNLDASCSGGATHQLQTTNALFALNGSFMQIPLLNEGNGIFTIKFPLYNSDYFQYSWRKDFASAEQTELNGQLAVDQMGVFTWGGREYSAVNTETHYERWGQAHGAREAVPYAANTTVTADAKITYADGITYYMNGGNMLVGLENVDITESDVSVSFGASEAEHFADGTGFIDIAGGSSLMRRVYDVNTSISSPVEVLFYYTDDEYDEVNNSLVANGGSALAGQSEMYMYKVTSSDPPLNIADIETSEVVILANGAGASQTTWLSEADCDLNIARYQVSSFSGGGGGGISGGGPLPVELISFNAAVKDKTSVLKWMTASEINNDYFEIEHSNNGTDFRKIGKIDGNGTSNLRNEYTFVDESPQNGINYYRLKQVDYDRKFAHSNIVSTRIRSANEISILPTVVQDKLTIQVSGRVMTVDIINQSGQMVYSNDLNFENGFQEINTSGLASGMYFLQIQNEGSVEVVKFVKR